jgi:excisionase family DNA binding protein
MNVLNSVRDTCRFLCMSRTALYANVRSGRIRPVKQGSRTLFHRDEIERYAAQLPAANDNGHSGNRPA